MAIIQYYIDAFKKQRDFKTTADRKDLNYFFLTYAVLFILLKIFGLIIIYIYTCKFDSGELKEFFYAIKIGFGCQILFTSIHILPIISLIKRRLNKLDLNISLLHIFIIMYLTQFIIHSYSFYFGTTLFIARTYLACLTISAIFILYLGLKNKKAIFKSIN